MSHLVSSWSRLFRTCSDCGDFPKRSRQCDQATIAVCSRTNHKFMGIQDRCCRKTIRIAEASLARDLWTPLVHESCSEETCTCTSNQARCSDEKREVSRNPFGTGYPRLSQKRTDTSLVVAKPSRRAMTMSGTVVEKGAGMRLIQAADEATINKLGCRAWPTWGCDPSTFPWTYSDDEVCLVLTGDFTVIPDDGSETMDVKEGDIAFFPKNMSCTWEVRKAVQKHFTFGLKL